GGARCGGAGYDEGGGEAHPGEDRTEVRPGVDEGLRDGGNQLPGRSAVLCRTTRWVASSMRWAALPGSPGWSSMRVASSAMCFRGWWTVVRGGLDHWARGTSS